MNAAPSALAPAIPALGERNYQRLIERLQKAEPSGGYRDARQMPPLSVSDIATVLRHDPLLMVTVRLDAEHFIHALEIPDIERSVRATSLHVRNAIETAVRNFVFVDVTATPIPGRTA